MNVITKLCKYTTLGNAGFILYFHIIPGVVSEQTCKVEKAGANTAERDVRRGEQGDCLRIRRDDQDFTTTVGLAAFVTSTHGNCMLSKSITYQLILSPKYSTSFQIKHRLFKFNLPAAIFSFKAARGKPE